MIKDGNCTWFARKLKNRYEERLIDRQIYIPCGPNKSL